MTSNTYSSTCTRKTDKTGNHLRHSPSAQLSVVSKQYGILACILAYILAYILALKLRN